MNKGLKVIILGAALVLPGLVFIFLKMFGQNQFDIPVVRDSIGCEVEEVERMLKEPSKIILLNIQADQCVDCNEKVDEIKRIHNRFGDREGFKIGIVSNDSVKAILGNTNITFIYSNKDLLTCFVEGDGDQLLLFDEQRRVRGQYPVERSEIDRLMTELDILYGNTYQ